MQFSVPLPTLNSAVSVTPPFSDAVMHTSSSVSVPEFLILMSEVSDGRRTSSESVMEANVPLPVVIVNASSWSSLELICTTTLLELVSFPFTVND